MVTRDAVDTHISPGCEIAHDATILQRKRYMQHRAQDRANLNRQGLRVYNIGGLCVKLRKLIIPALAAGDVISCEFSSVRKGNILLRYRHTLPRVWRIGVHENIACIVRATVCSCVLRIEREVFGPRLDVFNKRLTRSTY